MRFAILTIFPNIFSSYLNESLIRRAAEKGIIRINTHDIRKYSKNRHGKVDDKPYGGGPGMVLSVEPIYRAVRAISSKFKVKSSKRRIILFSTRGKKLDAKIAKRLSKYDALILICGRYGGVASRVAKHIADEEISIGDYVLTGGEIPAMILVDSITRLLPGVLGNIESLAEESFSKKIPNTKYQ